MNPKLLVILAGLGGLVTLGVGVQFMRSNLSVQPIQVARPVEPVLEERDQARFTRQSAIITRVETGLRDDGARALTRAGRAVGAGTISLRTEDFESQKERARGDRDLVGMVRSRIQPNRVPGVSIELYENDPDTKNPPLFTAVSDDEGSFTIRGINDQDMTYLAIARKDGYVPTWQRVTVSDRTNRLFFFMTTGTQMAGRVVDAVTSQGISGATVRFPTGGEPIRMLGEVVSDASGRFLFDAVNPGPVRIMASKDGYGDGVGRFRSSDEEILVPLNPGAGVIRGLGELRASKQPASKARIVVELDSGVRRSTLTADDGTFEFRDLPPGQHRVVGVRGGIESERLTVSLDQGGVVEDLKVVLPEDIFVQGRILKLPSDVPFPGVRVEYRGERGNQFVLTDQDGNFAIQMTTLEAYELGINEPGWEAILDGQAGLRDGSGTQIFAAPRITRTLAEGTGGSDRLTIRMKPTHTLRGRVVWDRGNQPSGTQSERRPATNANVTLDAKVGNELQRVTTRANAEGEFFMNLTSAIAETRGDVRLLASYGGMVGAENVSTRREEDIEIILRPTRLNARLELSDGEGLSDVRVEIRSFVRRQNPGSDTNAALPPTVQYTRRRGEFAAGLVPNQPYQFTFELPDGQRIEKMIARGSDVMPRTLFIYDPVVSDIIVVRGNNSGNRGGRGRDGGNREGSRGGQGGGQGGPGGQGGLGGRGGAGMAGGSGQGGPEGGPDGGGPPWRGRGGVSAP
jgi:hypothetical protein